MFVVVNHSFDSTAHTFRFEHSFDLYLTYNSRWLSKAHPSIYYYILYSFNLNNPVTIDNALNLPGEEGKLWELSREAEWQNMVDHNVFGPPIEPPPGTKILRMGTTL
jgi:hypothetical protein